MPPSDMAPLIVTIVIAVCAAATFILRGPVGKALARRLEGAVSAEPTSLESERRTAALEHRVAELEERLDFAERLLAHERLAALPRSSAEGAGR